MLIVKSPAVDKFTLPLTHIHGKSMDSCVKTPKK